MAKFTTFLDKKERDSRKHLKIVKKILESNSLKVADHLTDDDSYIFLYSPLKDLSFEGIRIYKIGNQLAFRVQKEELTQPFGTAYPLDIEEMFNDLMSDEHEPEKAGNEVIKAVLSEVKRFFDSSLKAENDLKQQEFDPSSGTMAVRNTSTDYSNLVYMRGY